MRGGKETETIIRQQRVYDEGAEYSYMLIMKESGRVTSYRIPLYSIQIKMTDIDGKKTEATAKDLFADVGKALVFYDRMVQNLATPIDLPYIIEDEL